MIFAKLLERKGSLSLQFLECYSNGSPSGVHSQNADAHNNRSERRQKVKIHASNFVCWETRKMYFWGAFPNDTDKITFSRPKALLLHERVEENSLRFGNRFPISLFSIYFVLTQVSLD